MREARRGGKHLCPWAARACVGTAVPRPSDPVPKALVGAGGTVVPYEVRQTREPQALGCTGPLTHRFFSIKYIGNFFGAL